MDLGANSPDMEKARKNIHQLVAVDANKYKINALGGISELQLTISNNSLYALDQGGSGTSLPGSRKTDREKPKCCCLMM